MVGAVRSLRKHMLAVELEEGGGDLLDTCGTGGSVWILLILPTAVAFVCASLTDVARQGAGGVVKHGNRAATSRSGSADVLRALGVNIECGVEKMLACYRRRDFVFSLPRFIIRQLSALS